MKKALRFCGEVLALFAAVVITWFIICALIPDGREDMAPITPGENHPVQFSTKE